MHELGLCTAIVDAIEKRARNRPVAKVRVRVGRLHHVHPEAFEQSFALAAAGSVADDARAELILVPITGRCDGCGSTFEAEDAAISCPKCGSFGIEQSGGDELTLESIVYRS